MKKILTLSVLILLSIQLITAQNRVRKVIIDTDTAGDDCMAIMMAAKSKDVKILGITVSAGNVSLEQALKQ